jgi:hypothetical protein
MLLNRHPHGLESRRWSARGVRILPHHDAGDVSSDDCGSGSRIAQVAGWEGCDAVIADPLKGEVKKVAEGREPRQQLQEAIEKAFALTRKRFPYLDSQIDIQRLIPVVVTFAFLPPLLVNPDYDRLLASRKISGDTGLAHQILEYFFPIFRKDWGSKSAFARCEVRTRRTLRASVSNNSRRLPSTRRRPSWIHCSPLWRCSGPSLNDQGIS